MYAHTYVKRVPKIFCLAISLSYIPNVPSSYYQTRLARRHVHIYVYKFVPKNFFGCMFNNSGDYVEATSMSINRNTH
jgi:hypothetical protein